MIFNNFSSFTFLITFFQKFTNLKMDFKKRMLSEYALKMNKILDDYKEEYQNIQKSVQKPLDSNPSLCLTSVSDFEKENNENKERIKEEVFENDEISFIECEKITDDEDKNGNENIHQNENTINVKEKNNKDNININNNVDQNEDNKFDYSKFAKSNTPIPTLSTSNIPTLNSSNNPDINTIAPNIDMPVSNSNNPNNSNNFVKNDQNIIEYSFNNSVNQSFLASGLIRKAVRRTGKLITKRKLLDFSDDCFKKRRTDSVENFLLVYSTIIKDNIKYEKEIEELKLQLKKEQIKENSKLEQEKKELERLKNENLEISKKIQKELNDLQAFKDSIFKQVKTIEEDKTKKLIEEDKTKKLFEEEYKRETIRLEQERTFIANEKRKVEEMKLLELTKINNERKRLEMEKENEISKMIQEKARLEQLLKEQNINLENERKLLKEEREKMNQTFLELTTKIHQEPVKPKEIKIQLPSRALIDLGNKTTIHKKDINSIFLSIKKEFNEKVNQTLLVNQKIDDPKVLSKQISSKVPENEKFDAHYLYKRSIDAQIQVSDPKKYVPKISIPFFINEDDFENEDKKFTPALFTKDPKLNYIVKTQDHNEIRQFFGNKKDIDVESIFNQIENVSNFSPNKLRNNRKGF